MALLNDIVVLASPNSMLTVLASTPRPVPQLNIGEKLQIESARIKLVGFYCDFVVTPPQIELVAFSSDSSQVSAENVSRTL